ncbi:fatty-acyl-CoA synthase [Paraphoma chrysanthemicola]|uniref:Fatty-acyl-CoA synthase n=1 Tax=Paraphoma chrysanthemicola TaxID=798071 RepID=A0A8K0RCR4_9PLEO|nr:fatty-acyl-CoA synthase [Paraphoma chrysanthemicola]
MDKAAAALAAITGTVGTVLAGKALEKKYSIRSDLAQIRAARRQGRHWEQLCKEFGDFDWSFYHVLHFTSGRNEYDEAFLFEDRSWTYAETRAEVGRLAVEFERMGIRNRTVVAMFINNSPEFYFMWWALFKIGAIPAPINTAITQEPFRHCLKISEAEFLFCTFELHSAVANSLGILKHNNLDTVHSSMAEWPANQRPKVGQAETSQYLFTSGTTGLPKAATWPTGYASRYALLPATVRSGGTVILARKFSVRNFWPDVRRTKVNMLFYIGEMVRYLVQAPPDPVHADEKKTHGIEIIYGLGLAEPVWRAFRDRFGVPWISEYYGSTEATSSISYSNVSNDEPVAKVAHWGPLMRNSWFGQDTFYIVRVDMDTGEVIRDPRSGYCIQAAYDEVGEAVNRIKPPLQRVHDYVGEGGTEATNKKLLRNVFSKGDLFWRLGDALSMDRHGYITFHDRLGDTFRAKGHNISTTEVEMAFLNHPHISSANVFAISMTQYGYDGQLGAAAITFRNGASPIQAGNVEIDSIRGLEQYLVESAGLANYAVPRFLRVLVDDDQAQEREQIGISDEVGSEYVSVMLKKLKTGLRKEAFSPANNDRMYWIEREGQGYVPLTVDTQRKLLGGVARL